MTTSMPLVFFLNTVPVWHSILGSSDQEDLAAVRKYDAVFVQDGFDCKCLRFYEGIRHHDNQDVLQFMLVYHRKTLFLYKTVLIGT